MSDEEQLQEKPKKSTKYAALEARMTKCDFTVGDLVDSMRDVEENMEKLED